MLPTQFHHYLEEERYCRIINDKRKNSTHILILLLEVRKVWGEKIDCILPLSEPRLTNNYDRDCACNDLLY